MASLPAYDEDFDDTAGSARNLSSDESSYSLRRAKLKLRHPVVGNCYYKVWLDRTLTPETGAPTVERGWQTYEWSAPSIGGRCVPADYDHEDPATWPESAEIVLDEPAEDGSYSVTARWSCVPGYEPDEEAPVNGYPPAA